MNIHLAETLTPILGKADALMASISGGKDSDVMLMALHEFRLEQGWNIPIVAIHCDVGRMEWRETLQHCEKLAEKYADEFHVLRHELDLVDGIKRRMATRPDAPPFPSSAARYCTAGWKREVCDKYIRQRWQQDATVIVATGLRDEESRARAAKPDCWERGSSAPTLRRTVFDWLPIRHWTLADVWTQLGYTLPELRQAQSDYHKADDTDRSRMEKQFGAHVAYLRGNERLSCALCVLGSQNDLRNGAEWNRDLYRELVQIEIDSGFSFQNKKPLSAMRPDLLTPDQLAALAKQTKQLKLF
jgi:DNA sulfur modification protein DndC